MKPSAPVRKETFNETRKRMHVFNLRNGALPVESSVDADKSYCYLAYKVRSVHECSRHGFDPCCGCASKHTFGTMDSARNLHLMRFLRRPNILGNEFPISDSNLAVAKKFLTNTCDNGVMDVCMKLKQEHFVCVSEHHYTISEKDKEGFYFELRESMRVYSLEPRLAGLNEILDQSIAETWPLTKFLETLRDKFKMAQLAAGMSPVKYADRPRNKSTVNRLTQAPGAAQPPKLMIEPRPSELTDFAAAQSLIFLSQAKLSGVPALLHRPNPVRVKRPMSPVALSDIASKLPALGRPTHTLAVPTAIRSPPGATGAPGVKPKTGDPQGWRVEQPGGPYFMLVPRGQDPKP